MKKLILAAAMVVSASSAFAQMRCEVDMIDSRGRLITTIRAIDMNDGCKEGMKACRLEIRQRNLYGSADCVQRTVSVPNPRPYPDTNPYPRPYPDTNPYPRPYPDTNPYPGQDITRSLHSGEQVYYNSRLATVIGLSYDYRTYAIRTTDLWNNTVNLSNINREALSVTSGCNYTLCVNDSIISLNANSSGRDGRIVGLSIDNRFVIETTDLWNNRIIQSSVDRNLIAEKKGCSVGRTQICVGDRVINNSNREGTVIAIQKSFFLAFEHFNCTVIKTNRD